MRDLVPWVFSARGVRNGNCTQTWRRDRNIDFWATLVPALKAPPTGEMKKNNGKPIYFESVDNSDYILGKSKHSARRSWIYINGEALGAVWVDIAGDPENPELNISWKSIFTSNDTWLGPTMNAGGIGSLYNRTMDPFEKCDMVFNGAMPSRLPRTSPGQYAGMDNGWALGSRKRR